MALNSNNFRFVFWMAVVPAFVALGVMVFAVHEPIRQEADAKPRLRLGDAKRLSGRFWTVVGIATIVTLARFSEAFLILRSQNVGLPVALAPVVMVLMNVVYALAAYPTGMLSDQIGRGGLLAVGMVCLIVADIILALGTTNYSRALSPIPLQRVFGGQPSACSTSPEGSPCSPRASLLGGCGTPLVQLQPSLPVRRLPRSP